MERVELFGMHAPPVGCVTLTLIGPVEEEGDGEGDGVYEEEGIGLAVVEHSGIPNSCQYWSLPAFGFQREPHCARVSGRHWAAMEAI